MSGNVVLCPLCRGEVAPRSSGCLACHLPMRDVLRHQPPARSAPSAWIRRVSARIAAVVLYAAVVAWCVFALPGTLRFVVPGAVLGAYLHAVKGRPWLGLLAFSLVVVIVPALLWPSMLTDSYADVTGG